MSLLAKIGIGVAVLLILSGAYAAWAHHQREIGRLEIVAKDAKVLAEQKEKDAALSSSLINELQRQIDARANTAQPVREVIRSVVTPCSSATGADVDATARWVRDALSQTGGPPARR